MDSPQEESNSVCVDFHVHYYGRYRFLSWFHACARADVACVTVGREANFFDALCKDVFRVPEGVSVEILSDVSLRLSGFDRCVELVRGLQLVSGTGIEVLVPGVKRAPERIRDTLSICRWAIDEGTVPLLPWGFGKWLGPRLRELRFVCEKITDPLFGVDGPSRPRCWPLPDLGSGVPWVSGSDPLPLAGGGARAGAARTCFNGFRTEEVSLWPSVLDRLRAGETGKNRIRRSTWSGVLCEQLRLRLTRFET